MPSLTYQHAHISADELLSSLPCPPRLISGARETSLTDVRTVCCDSRKAGEHDLFVCLKGALVDGHAYIPEAYKNGCRTFLVESTDIDLPPSDAQVFLTDNTRRDLALLAAAFYGHPAKAMRMVGITGTKGKTTVAMMCYHILNKNGVHAGYIGTCGVRYGDVHVALRNTTPGALELQYYLNEMQRSDVEVVLLEVSSQAIWQHRIDGICFDVCALTNLYPDHIGQTEHPTFAHYADCKRRLLTEYGAPIVIANADDEASEPLLEGITAELHLCGLDDAAHLCATQWQLLGENALPTSRIVCHDRTRAMQVAFTLPLPGEHNVANALFALSIATTLGISLPLAAAALEDVSIPGRFEMLPMKDALIVIDYAHNGAALRAALTALRPLAKGRLICLFGSVGERTQCRRRELGEAACALANYTYLTADDPQNESVLDICQDIAQAFEPTHHDAYTVIEDRSEAIRAALATLRAGDVLLIAGKGDERTLRIGGKELAHRDRDVVEQYMASVPLPI